MTIPKPLPRIARFERQDSNTGLFALDCAPYPYGTQLVVRVAELDAR